MAETTGISWCDSTFNPWRGCAKVSPGCAHCYAETMSGRNPAVLGEWGPNGVRVIASESYWRQPVTWNRKAERAGLRARVFCASLADVFEDRPDLDAPRARLLELINFTESLDWLLLTKRPENVILLLERCFRLCGLDTLQMVEDWCKGRPPPNVWLGVSVEDQQRADERIPHLLRTPAAVRFLSAEPLLGPVDLRGWLTDGGCYGPGSPAQEFAGKPQIDWLIVGGESGPGARPCRVEWVRSVVEQCRAAGVACFVKQLGSNPTWTYWAGKPMVPIEQPYCATSHEYPDGIQAKTRLRDKKGGGPSEWPEDLRVREFPRTKGVL